VKKVLFVIILSFLLLINFAFAEYKIGNNFTFKISERFRYVGFDNSISLNDNEPQNFTFTRNKTSFLMKWRVTEDIKVYTKLTNEFRVYLSPKNREFNIDEIFFDNLYVKWENPGNFPLDLTIGRQNIMLGEGFLVMDGGPLDGSRSIYFNAIRGDYYFTKDQILTGFLSYVPESDNLFIVINDLNQPLIEQPEMGFGLYYNGKFRPFDLQVYLIRKNIMDTEDNPISSGINTIGARYSYTYSDYISFTVEAAYQTGNYGEFDRSGLGGYFHFDYQSDKLISFLKKIKIGGIYLSGDNPETKEQEGWDPLFSRWPKWSDSFIYTLIKENNGKIAYWSNLSSIYATLKLDVTKNIDLDITYHNLRALENNQDNYFTSGEGTNRGNLFIAKMNFNLSENISGHFLWEIFQPGNYYFDGSKGYNWLRFELRFDL